MQVQRFDVVAGVSDGNGDGLKANASYEIVRQVECEQARHGACLEPFSQNDARSVVQFAERQCQRRHPRWCFTQTTVAEAIDTAEHGWVKLCIVVLMLMSMAYQRYFGKAQRFDY